MGQVAKDETGKQALPPKGPCQHVKEFECYFECC